MDSKNTTIKSTTSKIRQLSGISPHQINLDIFKVLEESTIDIKTTTQMDARSYYYTKNGEKFTIYIPTDKEFADKFQIAKQLGLIYANMIPENDAIETSKASLDQLDTDSSSFAQELLMPAQNFRTISWEYYHKNENSFEIENIAQALGVSVQNVLQRAHTLKFPII